MRVRNAGWKPALPLLKLFAIVPVITATRRLWLSGLLLLLPALAVGGLALGLLAREQTRLAEREAAAGEARRAAVESRARLVAESIELLVGDVQSALMATLLEAPSTEPRAFLSEWQATNPLVRDVFRATAEGRPVWGATSDSLRAWLANGTPWTTPEFITPTVAPSRAVEFAEMFGGQERQETRRRVATVPPPASASFAPALPAEAQSRGDITANVVQYQRARQEIQEVARLKTFADTAAKATASAESEEVSASAAYAAPALSAPAASAEFGAGDMGVGDTWESVAKKSETTAGGSSGPASASVSAPAPAPAAVPALTEPLLRSGWTPWSDETGLHVFAWRELPDRTVVGLELRLDAIKARLGEVFPASPEAGEAYALRDTSGATWHHAGGADLPVALEVPLASAVLPGWTVVGAFGGELGSSSGGVFTLGAALIALLVVAILAAGALLLAQARRGELEAARKTSFVANVSHELKTPLTTIRLYAELLAQGRVCEEAKRTDYLATIGRETERLARLVGNVLDFSRLEQGQKKYERVRFDLAAELRRLADVHGPRLAEAGLRVVVEAPEAFPITTDRDAVEQVVLNLLDNACKYAADGGEVRLTLEPVASAACVTVADRGPGVSVEQCERIFEKFHRVDDRLTAEKSGAGLGLSIARQLARGLGGDLVCRAREGGGAEFVLMLPEKF